MLRLIARGQAQQAGRRDARDLAKTVGHHIEHIYAKAGVATRAGATLFAMEHGLLSLVTPAGDGVNARLPDCGAGARHSTR